MNARNRRKQAKLLEYVSCRLWGSNDQQCWKLISRVKNHPRWETVKIHNAKPYRYYYVEARGLMPTVRNSKVEVYA